MQKHTHTHTETHTYAPTQTLIQTNTHVLTHVDNCFLWFPRQLTTPSFRSATITMETTRCIRGQKCPSQSSPSNTTQDASHIRCRNTHTHTRQHTHTRARALSSPHLSMANRRQIPIEVGWLQLFQLVPFGSTGQTPQLS